MSKILIAYGTRYGATAKTSSVLAKALGEKFNHEVTVIDLKTQPKVDISTYDSVIIGASIAQFTWEPHAKAFLKSTDFSGKKLFVFISSAGLTYNALEKGRKFRYKMWKRAFLDRPVKRRTKTKPISTAVFGGMVNQPGMRKLDNWKEEDIIKWAEEIGKIPN